MCKYFTLLTMTLPMTNTRSGLTIWTTPTVAAWWRRRNISQGMIINPLFQYQYLPPPSMHTTICEASIHEVSDDSPVAGLSETRTSNDSGSPNNHSSSDTLTPGTSCPNNAAIQGNAPNSGGKDLNLDDDSTLSDHNSFRSDFSWHSNVPEPNELLAQAMSMLKVKLYNKLYVSLVIKCRVEIAILTHLSLGTMDWGV